MLETYARKKLENVAVNKDLKDIKQKVKKQKQLLAIFFKKRKSNILSLMLHLYSHTQYYIHGQ